MVKLDIIVPVYDEGENIVHVLRSFERFIKTPFRVFLCYDRDDDNTLVILKSQTTPFSFEIVLLRNRGQGVHSAVTTGFSASTAPAVLVFPADDMENSKIIDTMVMQFETGAEIVVASRFIPGGKMVGCPWLKSVLTRLAAFSLYYLARLPVRDPTNGLRLFSRRVLDTIKIESKTGFAFSIELLVKCHRLKWKISEIPAVWMQRTKGTSRFHAVKWIPAYLRWYFYAYGTTYLRRKY